MRLFISFILAIALISPLNKSYAFSFSKPDTASLSPSASVSKYMKTGQFIKLSPRDISAVTGKKLSLFEKVSLKVVQIKMKGYLKKHPASTIADYYKSESDSNFNLLWFLLGLLVPIISAFIAPGVVVFILLAISPLILALVVKRDWITIKSVLLGLGISVIVLLLVGLLLASALSGWQ